MKPTNVAILEKPGHVSAGKEIKVVCQSLGGYPHPKLTWWLGTKMLKSNEEVSTIKAVLPTLIMTLKPRISNLILVKPKCV